MGDVKWIKLTTNVFDDEKFDAIRTLPDGNDIQLAWIKLLCLAGTCNENGFLALTKEIPYTDEMLANRFHMDVGIVQRAMGIFQRLNMVEVVDNVYMVSNWLKYQSGDRLDDIRRKDRERQARHRKKQREALEDHSSEGDDLSRDSHVTNNVTVTGFCSYSNSLSFNSISSNKENYITLINNYIYKDSEYILNNSRLNKAIEEWFIYKDNKKPKSQHHYDTEVGMSKLLTQIVKHDKEYGTDYVISCIDNTIANNYQGVVWKKVNKSSESKLQEDLDLIDNWSPTNDD